MNFLLTPEQQQLQDALARMLEECSDSMAVHRAIDAPDGFDAKVWQNLVDFGITGLVVPDQAGGSGLQMIDLALAAEVLGYHAAAVPFLGHALATLALIQSDDAALQARWLPRLADGSVLGTIALNEGDGQWLPEQWQLQNINGRISGSKLLVPEPLAGSLIVVGLAGGGLGLVEPDASGVRFSAQDGVDRTRRIAAVSFDNTPVTHLSAHGQRLLDAALVLLAADSFGGARRQVDLAVAYAKEREQFGVKIGSFQALRHQLANMAAAIEPCRGLYWYAAYAYDHVADEASAHAALAKAHLADAYMQVSRDSIEAHGGIGYTWEADPHIWFKRAMFNSVFAAAPAVHRERYALMQGW